MSKKLADLSSDEIRLAVSEKYGQVARHPHDKFEFPTGKKFALAVGYPEPILNELPPQCVQPFAGVSNTMLVASLQEGDAVLDVGCGSGMDTLIAGKSVGQSGKAIGIDVSSDMLHVAMDSQNASDAQNVEFVQGIVEQMPFENEFFDNVVSNGIFNLSPDKDAVAREIYRVLKPGGALTLSEIVLSEKIPADKRTDLSAWFT